METVFLAERATPRRLVGHRLRRWVARWLCLMMLGQATGVYAVTHGKPQTGRDVQHEAAQLIPWSRLEPQTAARVKRVVEKPSMFRRMPTEVIQCDGELFRFLTRYPEVVVNIWQLMGITKVTAHRTGPSTFNACDGAGTTTDVHLVYADDKLQVMYCDGEYQGPLFKRRLTGRCVLVVASGATPAPDGSSRVSARMDVFLQVDDLGIDVLARTLHPLLGKSADRNFVETLAFVEKVSRTAEQNGPGMGRLAGRLTGVQPELRETFSERCMGVYQKQLTQMAMPHSIDAPEAAPVVTASRELHDPRMASRLEIGAAEPGGAQRVVRRRP